MTCSIPRTSAIALGLAALVSFSPLSARADTSAAPAPAPSPAPASSAAAPSLSEPAPTPGWAESGPGGAIVAQHPSVRHYAHRHYAWRNGRRYYSGNPVASAATGVAGGVADLGSIAAYPFYCFPNYGSCSVRVPYRF
jgi:hypothetical protein